MIESNDVLDVMKIVFITYMTIIISFMGMYGASLSSKGEKPLKVKVAFYTWMAFLVFCGIGLHVLTFTTIPWVKWDLTRADMEVSHEFNIVMADQQFQLPEEKLMIPKGKMVRFNVESKDLTYGFGIFREDGSMVFQMQVVPGSKNDLVWKFEKPGKYSIRSTEYSGPRGGNLFMKDVVEVYSEVSVASGDSVNVT